MTKNENLCFLYMEIDKVIEGIEKNPWILAIMVVIGNIGFKYLEEDLNEHKCEWLKCNFMRKFVLFALIFCATKNLLVSAISTILYAIFIEFF